jgi:predicted NAD/FAD-binding protein
MRIAIIGAGVSGLTTAYYLKKNPLTADAQIVIYEKAGVVGGNADTLNVVIPTPDGPLTRWVDMGVNDFNLTTYFPLRELWYELGIMDGRKPCPASSLCSPLIDTESFSLPGADNQYSYRYSVMADDSIVVPKGSTANAEVLATDIENFKTQLAAWYSKNQDEGANKTTVGEWLTTQNFSDEFIFGNLYPRINGMYFTLEECTDPSQPPPSMMPLWMVAHYYILQEAYGHPIPPTLDCHRQYFVNGSIQWLRVLGQQLSNMGVSFNMNCGPLMVSKTASGMVVTGTEQVQFDKVIFATHADDTYSMIDASFSSDPMVQALQSFTFSSSTVFVHQDPSFLGPKDCNQTYNIHIYNYNFNSNSEKFPYSISYIVNMHQNDAKNPDPKIRNCPLFYITISPYWASEPANLILQPDGFPAVATLRHCTLNNDSVVAQVLIEHIQLEVKEERAYYFAGSFTKGAGLHMECIIQAQEIASKIADPNYTPTQSYKFGSKDRHFAPKYIMDAITRLKK